MTEERVFDGVKRACYAGLDSVTLRRTVTDRLQRFVPFDGYAFGTTDPDTGLLTHMVADGLPSRMSEGFVNVIYPTELVHLHHRMARAGNLVFSAMDFSPATDRHVRDCGFGYEVHVVLAEGGQMWGKCCFMHEGEATKADARARTMLRRLAPHLRRGLRTAALLEEGRAPVAAESSAPGVLVLDERARPVVRTELATALLDDVADVGLPLPDRIPLAVRLLIGELHSALRRAADDVTSPAEAAISVRGRSGQWYAIRASLAEPDASGACATVVIIQPLGAREVAPLLTRLYGLSAREREITAAVARGESTKEIAFRLGISPHTVVEHLERACDKVGVRGRKALVARMFFQGYAPGLGVTPPPLAG